MATRKKNPLGKESDATKRRRKKFAEEGKVLVREHKRKEGVKEHLRDKPTKKRKSKKRK